MKAHRMMAAVVLTAALLAGCGRSSEPPPQPTPVPSPVAERSVTFVTADGLRLTGRLFGSGRVGVVAAHMYPADATSWYPAARHIARAGYMVLAFNFRGYDGSQGGKDVPKAPEDVLAAANYLRSLGARFVVLMGASMGGTASLLVAASHDTLAVVAISAPVRFMGLDAGGGVVERIQRPVLLMAARDDASGAFDSLQQLAQVLPNATTRVYSGDAHGTALLERPGAVDVILAFLRRWAPATLASQGGEQ